MREFKVFNMLQKLFGAEYIQPGTCPVWRLRRLLADAAAKQKGQEGSQGDKKIEDVIPKGPTGSVAELDRV